MKWFPAEKDYKEMISEREHQAGVVVAIIFSLVILALLIIGSFIFIF